MNDEPEADETEFERLAHPTRVRILEVLAEQLQTGGEPLGFADLRRAVGMHDSGNFNYHLDALVEHFVQKSNGGYRITGTGLQVVAAVRSGEYDAGGPLGPEPLAADCPVCDAALTVRYAYGTLIVSCPNEHSFRNPMARQTVEERGLEGALDVLTATVHKDMGLASEGLCPLCHGELDWTAQQVNALDTDFPHFSNQCDRCGAAVDIPVLFPLLSHPTVIGFFDDHDIHIRRRPPWDSVFYEHVRTRPESDHLDVIVTLDEQPLCGTLDESLTVVSVTLQ